MSDLPEVLLVEDDVDLAQALTEILEQAGYQVTHFSRGEAALDLVQASWPGVILSDLRMPGLSGLDLLDRIKEKAPQVPFIMITGHGDVASAVRAMRAGAHDFLEKPCEPQLLLDVLRRAVEMRRLHLENEQLRRTLARRPDLASRLIGSSSIMVELRRKVEVLSGLSVDILLVGETGTGKELLARCLHETSDRRGQPFVPINCGALSEADIDRELFGVANEQAGRLASAQGGTLFLDELESMSDSMQVRLLRVLDRREVTPLGGGHTRQLDFAVLGSLKSSPEQLFAAGRLRPDLYHRFNAGSLQLPPLRDREQDAVELLEHFISEAVARHDLPHPEVSQELKRRVLYYRWPGNVRELRNMAERLVIGLEVIFPQDEEAAPATESYDSAMDRFEARLLQAALLQTGGRKSEAAALLGIPRKRLYLRLRHCGLA